MEKRNKTALVLGGGGSRGAYEVGVWQALREMDIQIDTVTGASVGAINGAMVAQDSFDLTVELWNRLENDMIFDKGILKKEEAPLKALLENYVDEDAVRKSPVDYGLVTVELPSLTPRYLYKDDIPSGRLIDFIIASASLFPALLPHDIDNIKYVDGGYHDSLPVEMAIKKGANRIIAVDLDSGVTRPITSRQKNNTTVIRSKWDLGNILVFKGSNASRIMRLGYLDTLRTFGFCDGGYYCFPKGHLNKKALECAETAGRLFGVEPVFLYSKDTFDEKIKRNVLSYRKEIERELSDFNKAIRNGKIGKKGIPNLLQKINERTMTIIIADYLRKHPSSGKTFLTKSALMLFKELYKAAIYLNKANLI